MILLRLETGSAAWVNDLCMRMTSTQASEDYAWLGTAPALREFVGGRQPAELAEKSFVVSNKDYEGSLNIKSKDMRRDKLGMIQVRVNQLADRALDHPAKILSALIIDGESTACYDGQYFFDTDHDEGESGTQSNDITFDISDAGTGGTPTEPTAKTVAQAILKGIQQMYTLKDDRGEPMNQGASGFTVMLPVSMMAAGLEAVTAELTGGGDTNVLRALRGRFNIDIVPNPRLTWTDRLAVFRTDDAAKPFILQEEDIPDVIALGEGSEYEQLNKEQLFGIDWTGNVAYGYWQHACLVTLQA
ncbi:Mu-like prophage major head subunit gpT family protein [Oceaniradius stylonematis]|uniref:Mu-like prophage major head subunit gpT family protein n=1 Tax=Oceaniradius stylonematis TaxID=2184161 RepID=UPI003B5A687F